MAGPIFWTRSIAQSAAQAVPQAGKIHPVSGGAIHYVDIGPKDGVPVVMIHGLGGQLQHFTYALTTYLQDDFRLIVLDRPGCGYSTRDNIKYSSLKAQGRMIFELLDDLGLHRPVLVGHSLGGAVALGMAVESPSKTGALALIAPLTHRLSKPAGIFASLAVKNPIVRKLLSWTIAVPIAQFTGAATLKEVFKPEPPTPSFVTRAGGVLGLRPKAFVTSSEDYVASGGIAQLSEKYKSMRTRGVVLFGEKDAILAAQEQGRPMVDFGLSYHELRDRGHMLPMTAPKECADLVREAAALRQ